MKVDVERGLERSTLKDITFNTSVVGAFLLAALLYRRAGVHKAALAIERQRRRDRDRGPDRQIPIRTAVIGLFASGILGMAPQIKAVHNALDAQSVCRKIASGFARAFNPKIDDPSRNPEAPVSATYETSRVSLGDFLDPFDWSRHRHPNLTEEERDTREAATYEILDTMLDFTWSGESKDGIYSVDASAHRGSVRQGTIEDDIKHSNEPDAGPIPHKKTLGFQLQMVSTIDAATDKRVIVGFLITSGYESEPAGGKRLFQRLLARGHNIKVVVFDRGYGQNTKLCDWLMNNGVEVLTDLKDTQRKAKEFAGGVALDGRLYCPSIPESLRDLGPAPHASHKKYRGINSPNPEESEPAQAAFNADRDAYIAKVEARTPYLARNHKADGSRVSCPAKRDRDVECELVDPDHIVHDGSKSAGALQVLPLVSGSGKLCQQTAVTLPNIIGGCPRQHVRYGTREWFDLYAAHRSPAEGFFGWMKRHDSDGTAAIADDSLRLTGIGRVTLMIGSRLLGYNLRQSDLRSRVQRHADRDHANWMVATGAFPQHHGADCTHATDHPDYIDCEDAGVDSMLDLLGLFPPRR